MPILHLFYYTMHKIQHIACNVPKIKHVNDDLTCQTYIILLKYVNLAPLFLKHVQNWTYSM